MTLAPSRAKSGLSYRRAQRGRTAGENAWPLQTDPGHQDVAEEVPADAARPGLGSAARRKSQRYPKGSRGSATVTGARAPRTTAQSRDARAAGGFFSGALTPSARVVQSKGAVSQPVAARLAVLTGRTRLVPTEEHAALLSAISGRSWGALTLPLTMRPIGQLLDGCRP
jgi:hypothetical protein